MKKLFLLVMLFSITTVLVAENQPKYVFCRIVGTGFLKIKVTVDYGDIESGMAGEPIVGKDGKPIKFNSMVGALNYMGMNGWEFVQAYAVSMGNQSVYNYLMKKPYNELDEDIKKLYKWD